MRVRLLLLILFLAGVALHVWAGPAAPEPAERENAVTCRGITTLVFYPRDLDAAKAFYKDKLDFKEDYSFNKGVAYGCKLTNGGVEIVLVHVVACAASTIEKFEINIRVAAIDPLYKLLCDRGVKIVKKPEATDWKTRWFQIQDPDGLIIAFEEVPPDPDAPGK